LEFIRLSVALAGTSLVGCGDDGGGDDTGTDSGGGDSGGGDSGGGDTGSGDSGGGDTGGGDSGGGDSGGGDSGAGDASADATADAGSMCSGDTIEADISNNHMHTLSIPVADIVAGVDKDYVTGGTTGHCHVVTITAADFAALRAGDTVRVVSCNNTEHEYALSCVDSPTAADPAPTCGGSDEGRYTGTCTGDTFTP